MKTAAHEPVRVLLLLTQVFANGGIQRFNQTFIAALTELEVHCTVLSMQDTGKSVAAQTLHENVTVRGFGGNRRRFVAAIVHALWSRRYDWVMIGHINLLSMTMAVVRGNPFMRCKTLMIAHGIEVWYRISGSRRRALARLSSILCVSEYTRSRILEQVPTLVSSRLKIFPNALGATWAAVKAAPLGRIMPQRFILSVTRLQRGDRYKGVTTVIETLGMLEDMSLHYVVVGQGDDLRFMQRVAQRCGVADRVHFLSGIGDEELINLYVQCEAFVLPSGKEGFGIVFLEAMFFGAPVIAAAEKGALDVVRHEQTGLLVRFGDAVALKRAIEHLRSNALLRDHLRRTARATVVGSGAFTFSRFTERSAEVLGMRRGHAA